MRMTASRRLLGAQLGLLAFVLIAFAPLFSQLRADSSDWSWLAELACHDGNGKSSSAQVDAAQRFSLDACAYCSLLINSPALGSLDWGRFDISVVQAVPSPLRRQPDLQLRFPTSQSRAPPALT
jgi:hypothetical protein